MGYSVFIPTQKARKSLAEKLGLTFSEGMQDWEYEVSDYQKLPEFIAEYDKRSTSDKEKESLMEMMSDSLNDLSEEMGGIDYSEYFTEIVSRLKTFSNLHAGTLSYWTRNFFNISERLKAVIPDTEGE